MLRKKKKNCNRTLNTIALKWSRGFFLKQELFTWSFAVVVFVFYFEGLSISLVRISFRKAIFMFPMNISHGQRHDFVAHINFFFQLNSDLEFHTQVHEFFLSLDVYSHRTVPWATICNFCDHTIPTTKKVAHSCFFTLIKAAMTLFSKYLFCVFQNIASRGNVHFKHNIHIWCLLLQLKSLEKHTYL